MCEMILVILIIGLFGSWIAAELRGSRGSRISLGLACMLVLAAGIYVVMESTELHLALYRMGLTQIDRRLEAGQVSRVRKALQVFDEAYKETGSQKAAISRMSEALSDTDR